MRFNPGDFVRHKFSGKIGIVTTSSDYRPSISVLFEGTDASSEGFGLEDLYEPYTPEEFALVIDNGHVGFFLEKNLLDIQDPESKDPSNRLYVYVYGDECDRHPHIHIYDYKPKGNRDKRKGACLSLILNSWFDHSGHVEKLTKDQFNALVKVLHMKDATAPTPKKNNKFRKITWWKFLLRKWNEYNPNLKPFDPKETPMPDYDYKTLTVWKERKK